METKIIHYNIPQLRAQAVSPHEYYGVMARGTGKSQGIIAQRSVQHIFGLPRSTGVFVQRSFAKMLSQFLPSIVRGWEQMGYVQGVHFLINKKPSEAWIKKWKYPGPLQPLLTYEHTIVWFNGSVIKLISQDGIGSANGLSIDYVLGDEAKLLHEERLFDELLPANRGVIPQFKDNPLHHSLTFTTDMPTGTAGKWILKKKALNNPKLIRTVIHVSCQISKLEEKLYSTKSDRLRKSIEKQLVKYNQLSMQMRKELVFYDEASALDNIHALGLDKIKSYMRTFTPFRLRTSILNMLPRHPEDGFYPALDEEEHGYFSYDYKHVLDSRGYDYYQRTTEDDCLRDGDIDLNRSLHIGMDYNKSIWPIVTGQVHGNELRVLSGMHVMAPKGLGHAIEHWAKYYKPHKKKVVYFWYDQTAIGETRSPIADDIEKYLRSYGWTVIRRYFGGAPQHEAKYRFLDKILRYEYEDKFVTFNRDNCDKLLTSMFNAEATIRGKDGFAKDKALEKDKNADQSETTHYSDAFDTLLWGVFKSGKSHSENEELLPAFQAR